MYRDEEVKKAAYLNQVVRSVKRYGNGLKPGLLNVQTDREDPEVFSVNGVEFLLKLDRNANIHGVSMCKHFDERPQANQMSRTVPASTPVRLNGEWVQSSDIDIAPGTLPKDVARQVYKMYSVSEHWK